MARIELKGYSIDDITKALGATAIAAYVLGYIVLSYYLSAFGFNPASPFRPRVLSTGICMLVFFAIPIMMGVAVASIRSRGISTPIAILLRVLSLPVLCNFIAFLLVQTMPNSIVRESIFRGRVFRYHNDKTVVWILAILAGISTIIIVVLAIRWVWHNFHKQTGLSVLVLCLISTLFIYLELHSREPVYERQLFLWFLSVSVVTCILIGPTRELHETGRQQLARERAKDLKSRATQIITELTNNGPEIVEVKAEDALSVTQRDELLQSAREAQEYFESELSEMVSDTSVYRLERFIFTYGPLIGFGYILIAISMYIGLIFPLMPQKIGGGEVVRATIYQSRPDHTSSIIHGGMLDQSDDGIYILPDGHDMGLFIPKERIEGIYFSDDSTGMEKIIQ